MENVIIGLVGYPASGKDTVAHYLESQHEFKHVSTGDMVRKAVAERNLGEATREVLHEVSNELRHIHGAGYFAREAINNNSEEKKLIVSGMRTVGEAQEIKNHGGIIVAIDVSQKVRFERARARGSARDHGSFEAFKTIEDEEAQNTDPSAQNALAVINMAEYKILNEGSVEELHGQVNEIINKISPRAV